MCGKRVLHDANVLDAGCRWSTCERYTAVRSYAASIYESAMSWREWLISLMFSHIGSGAVEGIKVCRNGCTRIKECNAYMIHETVEKMLMSRRKHICD